ncbi:Hsp20/alpha crystallin family protein [Cesiribacter sp. SM1]|uniref:Hsp20/alpha crystallin family protein n=1 Tax=Cesiribacter sp. SM1 TaxID=2861196 RepID=UPI001CD21611|nr:Hsp20/alpha crystallin family protein [Cesiribacter sp. SM1]
MVEQKEKEVIMTSLSRFNNGSVLPGFFDLTRDWLDWNNSNFSNTGSSIPAVNIRETADGYEVEMAAPGMSKKDFRIELDNNVLTISSEKRTENEQKEGERYTKREFSYQSFQRSFSLPKEVVDDEKIQAKYEDGVLRLSIPKKEEAKPRPPKQIAIR